MIAEMCLDQETNEIKYLEIILCQDQPRKISINPIFNTLDGLVQFLEF